MIAESICFSYTRLDDLQLLLGSLGGSVATLQSPRDRLARCSSWPLRFAVYTSGGNLSRRSSCWQSAGTCDFHCPYRDVEELLAERGLHADSSSRPGRARP